MVRAPVHRARQWAGPVDRAGTPTPTPSAHGKVAVRCPPCYPLGMPKHRWKKLPDPVVEHLTPGNRLALLDQFESQEVANEYDLMHFTREWIRVYSRGRCLILHLSQPATAWHKGVADLLICFKGRWLSLELKGPKAGPVKPEQRAFLDKVTHADGISAVIKQVSQVREIIEQVDKEAHVPVLTE